MIKKHLFGLNILNFFGKWFWTFSSWCKLKKNNFTHVYRYISSLDGALEWSCMKYSLLVRFNCSLFGVNSIAFLPQGIHLIFYLFHCFIYLFFAPPFIHLFIVLASPPSPPPPLPNIIWYQAEFKETWRGAGGLSNEPISYSRG